MTCLRQSDNPYSLRWGVALHLQWACKTPSGFVFSASAERSGVGRRLCALALFKTQKPITE